MRLKVRHQGARGFTLIELLTAMGIAGILMAIAIPQFMSWLPTINLGAGERQVAADLQFARTRAISQNTPYRVTVAAFPATSYTVEVFTGGAYVTDRGPVPLPQGITMNAVSAAFNFTTAGTASSASTITLGNINGVTTTVTVNPVGRVRVP